MNEKVFSTFSLGIIVEMTAVDNHVNHKLYLLILLIIMYQKKCLQNECYSYPTKSEILYQASSTMPKCYPVLAVP